MRISELKRNDVIRIFEWGRHKNILAIVDEPGGTNKEKVFTFGQKLKQKMVRKSR